MVQSEIPNQGGEDTMNAARAVCLILTFLLVQPHLVAAAGGDTSPTQSSYRLQGHVIGSAGLAGGSPGYQGKGTAAQPTPIGIASSADKVVYLGFWPRSRGTMSYVLETIMPGTFETRLFQNYPNPFQVSTAVEFTLAEDCAAEVSVFSVTGQRVRVLVDESRPPGLYRVVWDGRDNRGSRVSPGVYFYRIQAGSYERVRKMILLK
jgi:hypothetical protein